LQSNKRTSNCCGFIVVRPPFFSGAVDVDCVVFNERSAAPIEPSDSLPDLPFVVCDGCCCSSFCSSKSSLSVPLIRRLAVDGEGVDVDSDVLVTLAIVSVDAVATSSFSVVTAEAAASAAFFLLPRGVAGFFFSPAVLLLLLDFGGRVSGTTMGAGLSPVDGDNDAVVGADDGVLK
jgi:hypothetical protein